MQKTRDIVKTPLGKAGRRVAGSRLILALAAGVMAASLLAACGGDDDDDTAASGKVVVLSYAGINGDAIATLLPKFEKDTGIEVEQISGTDADYGPKLKQATETGNSEWDVALGAEVDRFETLNTDDAFAAIDTSQWDEATVKSYEEQDLIGENWVGGATGAAVLIYSDKFEDDPPTTWADFFDLEKYPGKRGIAAGGPGAALNLEYALLGDGVSPDQLYPLDIDRAIGKLESIRDDLVLWELAPDGIESVVRGDTAMTWSFGGAAAVALATDEPVGLAVPPGTAVVQTRDTLLPGGPNPEGGQEFMRWFHQPEIQAEFSEATSGGFVVPVEPVLELIPESMRAILPFSPPHEDDYRNIDYGYYTEESPEGGTNLDQVINVFSSFRVG